MSDFSQFHPDRGIDRKQLKRLKQRFVSLNSARLDRTRQAIGVRQQLFLDVLPLLLHVNHPMLPGYNGAETPCGVPYFKPDAVQVGAARMIARSFTLRKDFRKTEPAIDSVFIMGSVGSIAHSERSDFDVWVCHKPGLKRAQLNRLQDKCDAIGEWAQSQLSIEAHFFLVSSGSAINTPTSMNAENSGSAQQNLLLDEFYRSAIWLAGKTPLWWYVPYHEEENYEYFTKQLLHKRFVRKQDVVDFGPITHIPTQEYLGAGIWQLYKAISAPHKSVLKLLLLEAYAMQSDPKPLALDFKRLVQTREPDPDAADGYLLIYHRIESYLRQSNSIERLELARRCFYFKVNKPLSRAPRAREKSWQRRLLEQLVDQWQWTSTQLLKLDSHKLWKVTHVCQERDLLIRELSKSYRLLSGLSHRSFQDASITSEEMAVLGRKLHAAFERKSGKVERVNPGISNDLSEPFLSLFAPDKTQDDWRLYRCKATEVKRDLTATTPIKTDDSPFKLILWCLWNGVLAENSHLDLPHTIQLSDAEKSRLIRSIRLWVGAEKHPPHETFLLPAKVTRVLLVINATQAPYRDLQSQGLYLLSENNDALNYSGLSDNLIQQADIAYVNSWNELLARNFKANALIEALTSYLRFAPPHLVREPPELTIQCPNLQLGDLIATRVESLVGGIRKCFYGSRGNPNARYIYETQKRFYVLQFQQGHPKIVCCQSLDELLDFLETPQLVQRPTTIDQYALQGSSLRTIILSSQPGKSYLYYEYLSDSVVYTYVDESGALLRFRAMHYSEKAFPSQTVNFIETVNARLSSQGELFSLDHFDSDTIAQPVLIRHIKRSGTKPVVDTNPEKATVSLSNSLEIKVFVNPGASGKLDYTLLCDNTRYSSSRGDPFQQAAQHVYRKRADSAPYHCYISDLDLTACSELIAPETGLTLVHYLREKRSIEALLNERIQDLIS